MTRRTEDEDRSRGSGSARRAGLARAAEFIVLAVLLVVDFELGVRLLVAEPGGELVAAGLSTALVAIVVAVLALARMSLPPRVTVTSAFVVSLLASAISAAAGTPLLALTEAAALMVITVLGLRESSPRGAVLVGAAALAVTVAAVSRLGFDTTVVLLALLAWGCVVAVGIAGRYVTMRRESALEAARRAERMELARELHDVVAHQITGIVVQAQAALTVARTEPERVAEGFSAIESAGTEALAGMRRMVGAIRDEADPGAPLTVPYELADIPDLVDRFDPGRQRTTLRLEATDAPVPPGVGESAYRVVREALTNVRRHAPEGFTRVSVRVIDSELVIQVGNDGVRSRSISPGSSGFGLTGMAERVDTLGGKMRAGPEEPDSWSVWVCLPLDAVT